MRKFPKYEDRKARNIAYMFLAASVFFAGCLIIGAAFNAFHIGVQAASILFTIGIVSYNYSLLSVGHMSFGGGLSIGRKENPTLFRLVFFLFAGLSSLAVVAFVWLAFGI